MPATLILADHTGRLGNRLILYSHVIAAAEEYGCRVMNLSILAASHFFAGLHRNPWGAYPRQNFPIELRWLTRALRGPLQSWVRGRRGKSAIQNRWLTVLDMENKPSYQLDSPHFARVVQSSRYVILWGYPFRCPALVRKHSEKIRDFFRMRAEAAPQAVKELAACRAAGRKSLCVHIRQDDAVGIPSLYLPPECYAHALRVFFQRHPREAWEVFICSDGVIPSGMFPGVSWPGAPRSLAEDYGLMAGSDAIMGFQSTLSIFAAFASAKPFLRVQRETASPEEKRGVLLDVS